MKTISSLLLLSIAIFLVRCIDCNSSWLKLSSTIINKHADVKKSMFFIRGGAKKSTKKSSKKSGTKKSEIDSKTEDNTSDVEKTEEVKDVISKINEKIIDLAVSKPNKLIVDDSQSDDPSTVSINPTKMEELGLFNGDSILLKGKKRKTTVAVINSDENVDNMKIKMTSVVRSNLRF